LHSKNIIGKASRLKFLKANNGKYFMNKAKTSNLIFFLIIAAALLFSGCAGKINEGTAQKWVAPSPDQLWVPSSEEKIRGVESDKKSDIPEELIKPGQKWQLIDIIEVALRNNPQTRSAWHAACAAYDDYKSKKGDYYPRIDAQANLVRFEKLSNEIVTDHSFKGFQPSMELTWLLFNFGGRRASIEEKRQALFAANFGQNNVVQNVIYKVIETFFQYAYSKALVKAQETSLNEASISLMAAEDRHKNGLATIADVLQAQTALSQAKLNLEGVQGTVNTIRGALATAIGIPANTPYDIEDLPLNPPINRIKEEVDSYIKTALEKRPDLAAQRSKVEQAMAHIKSVKSTLYPNLIVSNSLEGLYYDFDPTTQWESRDITAFTISIPVFKGFSRHYDILKAVEDAKTQKSQLESLEQSVILEVWSSYFDLNTSEQRVKTSNDLLTSAKKSYEVSLGRYKEGVGGFLDLLSAQSILEKARAQWVEAQANWYISISKLTRATGTLWTQNQKDKENILDIFPTTTIKEQKNE
jgi:outer membrane protein TolC